MTVVFSFQSKDGVKGALGFDKNATEDDMERVEALIEHAGHDGHVVLYAKQRLISPEEKKISILRWNHVSWDEVREAIREALQKEKIELR